MTTQITTETLPTLTHNQHPVITTELLAKLYGTEANNIKVNHTRNRERFEEGKHYFKLEGEELRVIKHRVTQSNSAKIARNVRSLILWTERGAARHAKMLETDQAWEVFEKLEDCYFNIATKEVPQQPSLPLGHYNFPAETADPHHREFANASLTPRAILDERNRAPELELLDALEQDGYDVTGARLRIQAMYYIADDLLYIQRELAEAGRYMQQVGYIIRNGTSERGMDVCFGRGGQLPTTFRKRELPKKPKVIRRQLVCGN